MNHARTAEEKEPIQSQVVASLSERIRYYANLDNRSVSAYIAQVLDKNVPMIKPTTTTKKQKKV